MPRRTDARTLGNVQLTPAQYAAVQAEAQQRGMDVSHYIRHILAENVPAFDPGAIPRRGTYDRRRQFVGLCIGDEDVVVLDDGNIYAEAWMEGWHRDEAGAEVLATYNLSTGDNEPQQFATLSELLDAMGELAAFDAWRVEGEDE